MASEFVPGQDYDTAEVRDVLEAEGDENDFVVGGGGMALFVRMSDKNDGPYFPDRSALEWPSELPKSAVDMGSIVRLFVRMSERTVRYIGDGRATRYASGTRLPRHVRFTINPPLARARWLDLMADRLPPAGPHPEAPLADLTLDASADVRWAALATFLERWHATSLPQPPARTETTIGPRLLRNMLAVHAIAPHVVSHNELVHAEDLVVDDGKIVFLIENQGVCLWATEPDGNDPRVWYRNNDEGEPWIEEPERLSGFLIQAILFEAILHAEFGASATSLSADTIEAILARVAPLGSDRWNRGGARFFGRDGALVMTMENDVWLAARTPVVLSRFEDLVDESWEHVAF